LILDILLITISALSLFEDPACFRSKLSQQTYSFRYLVPTLTNLLRDFSILEWKLLMLWRFLFLPLLDSALSSWKMGISFFFENARLASVLSVMRTVPPSNFSLNEEFQNFFWTVPLPAAFPNEQPL